MDDNTLQAIRIISALGFIGAAIAAYYYGMADIAAGLLYAAGLSTPLKPLCSWAKIC